MMASAVRTIRHLSRSGNVLLQRPSPAFHRNRNSPPRRHVTDMTDHKIDLDALDPYVREMRRQLVEGDVPATDINEVVAAASTPEALEKAAEVRARGEIDDKDDDRDFEPYLFPPETRDLEPEPPLVQGFFSEDETDDDPGDDPHFDLDDITPLAHGELEQVRELREMLKVAAWDMPLLAAHARPFEAPGKDQVLRFRYTSYMGIHHAGACKVVMTFSPSALAPLANNSVAQTKLIKLLAARYDPSKSEGRLSCDRFPTVAQNKRFVSDKLDTLIQEALDPTDTFEDIPFDFRHHRPKKQLEFPEGWKLTDQRAAMLAARNAGVKALEEGRVLQGQVVDGRRIIEGAMRGAMQKTPVTTTPAGKKQVRRP